MATVPMEIRQILTKQKFTETLRLVRYQLIGIPAWQFVLVSYDKLKDLDENSNENFDVTKVGRVVKYRDENGQVKQASGYKEDPSKEFEHWMFEQYDPISVDATMSVIYTKDDIRMCTVEDLVFQLLYHRHENFHFVKLDESAGSAAAAARAGMKNYDRLIEFNGECVENETHEQLLERFNTNRHSPIQLLVCDPVTHVYYKSNNRRIHRDLPTVEHVTTIRNTTTMSDNDDTLNMNQSDSSNIQDATIESTAEKPSLLTSINEDSQNEFKTAPTDLSFFDDKQIKSTDTSSQDISPDVLDDSWVSIKAMPISTPTEEREYIGKSFQQPMTRSLFGLIGSLLGVGSHESELTSNDIHHVQCEGCKEWNIRSDRYKCLDCQDYNLCAACYEKQYESKGHLRGHAFAHFIRPNQLFHMPMADDDVTLEKLKQRFVDEKHEKACCDACDTEPIVGLRFKCDTCLNYDLCLTCKENGKTSKKHTRFHSLILVKSHRLKLIEVSDVAIGQLLGKGAFGAVYKSRWISQNRQVACKVIPVPAQRPELQESFLKELNAYNEVSGAYILKTFGYMIYKSNQNGMTLYGLISEFMSRGSLKHVLQQKEKLSLRRKVNIAYHIASGMRKLHEHRIIHRDIRPDNILVAQDYTAKIGDMGIARVLEPEHNENLSLVGCQIFMPLEFYTGKYDHSLDVYTFGLTVNELFTEVPHTFNLWHRKATLTVKSPIFSDLIERCISECPSQRPSAIEIETTLEVYKEVFEKIILVEYPDYIRTPIAEKNHLFNKFYEDVSPQIKSKLREKFPSPPPPLLKTTDDDETIRKELLFLGLVAAAIKKP